MLKKALIAALAMSLLTATIFVSGALRASGSTEVTVNIGSPIILNAVCITENASGLTYRWFKDSYQVVPNKVISARNRQKVTIPFEKEEADFNDAGVYRLEAAPGKNGRLKFTTVAVFVVDVIDNKIEQPEAEPYTARFEFEEETSDFLNPERGWWLSVHTDKLRDRTFSKWHGLGSAIVLLEADLGDFLNGPLSDNKVTEIRRAFNLAREAGLTVIFRAAYDFDGTRAPEPKNLSVILGHIQQMRDIFYENEDILFSIQAGFLGPWGEWHNSFYGNPPSTDVQNAVVDALLAASPPSVTIAVRRPMFIRAITNNGILTAAEAFSGTKLSRISYHNDAILSTESDMGTYSDRTFSRQQELDWTNDRTRFVPFAAEANTLSSYSDIPAAIDTLDYMNLQSLNVDYLEDVLDKWRADQYNGANAFEYIGGHLGYRFVLDWAEARVENSVFTLRLQLRNDGFGSLMKQKDLELILKRGDTRLSFPVDDDARRWDEGTIERTYSIQLASNMDSGEWDVFLALRSPFGTLKDNPAYSVRFANAAVWDETMGMNKLGTINLPAY